MVLCSISYITGTTRVSLLLLLRNHHHFFPPSPSKRVREYNLSYRGQSVDFRSVFHYPTIIAILLVAASCPSPPLPPLLSHDYTPKLILPLRQWLLPRKNRSRIIIIFPIRICPCCSFSWLRPQFIHVPGLRYVTSADDGIMSTASPPVSLPQSPIQYYSFSSSVQRRSRRLRTAFITIRLLRIDFFITAHCGLCDLQWSRARDR